MTALRSLSLFAPAVLLGLMGFTAQATRSTTSAARSSSPSSAPASGTVFYSLTSAQNGASVLPGQRITWNLQLETNGATHFGLAGFAVDLIQDANNPEFFDLVPGEPVASSMLGFDRPLGFSNPAPEPRRSGFGGVPTGKPGARNLEQIGGMQNTFGVVPDCLGPQADICAGQRVQVEFGVAQNPGGVFAAAGSFIAPRTPGTYTFALSKAQATVLVQYNAPPSPSKVGAAACNFLSDSFSIQVQ